MIVDPGGAKPSEPDAPERQTPGQYDARWGYRTIDVRRYEARRYASPVRRLNFRLLQDAIARALRTVAPGSLGLDVPCGTGVLTGLLTRRHRVTSADISQAMLDVAQERGRAHGGTTGLVRADVEALPFKSGSFEFVVSNRFIMHLPADVRPRVLRELVRVSRGPVVVTVCHPYTVKSLLRAVRRGVGLYAKRSPRIRPRELAREAASVGLRVQRSRYVLPLLSEVFVAVLERA